MEDAAALKELIRNVISENGETSMDALDSEAAILHWLSQKIEHLIAHDFEGLLFLLYRIDVSELKVRQMLAATGGEAAATTIASLIIERQKQKLALRQQMRKFPTPTDDPERW